MKAALLGLAAPGYVTPSKPGPAGGGEQPQHQIKAAPGAAWPGALPAASSSSPTPPGDRDWRLFAVQTSLRVATSLRSQPLPFLRTPTIGISLIWSTLAGWRGKVPVFSGLAAKGHLRPRPAVAGEHQAPPPKMAAF